MWHLQCRSDPIRSENRIKAKNDCNGRRPRGATLTLPFRSPQPGACDLGRRASHRARRPMRAPLLRPFRLVHAVSITTSVLQITLPRPVFSCINTDRCRPVLILQLLGWMFLRDRRKTAPVNVSCQFSKICKGKGNIAISICSKG